MANAKTKATAKPKGDASASTQIDNYIADRPDWRGKMLAKIRKVFLGADRAIIEEWKWMGSPVWSHPSGQIAVANAHKDKVKVTFTNGAALPDPKKVFNAGLGGGKWRAIDLTEGDKLDEAGLKGLVKAAIDFNLARKKK
jgi:hypothetical protein